MERPSPPGPRDAAPLRALQCAVLANETLWGVGYSLITVIMGHMAASGDLIAAYTVAGSIDKLSTAGIYGIANAAAVIVGKEIGIGSSHESVVRIGKAVCLTAFLFALALGGVELLAFLRCSGRMCCRFSPSRRARRRCARSWCTATRV